MATLDQMRHGLSRAWESVTEGWHELLDRAGDALTRFQPRRSGGEVETREDRIARSGARWSVLAAEVQLDEDEVEVAIEVPGMDAGDFQIHVLDDQLIVRGEKRVERERKEGRYHVMERAYGAFERRVPLPAPVDGDAAKARYSRGVLQVTLPLASTHRPRRIEVTSG